MIASPRYQIESSQNIDISEYNTKFNYYGGSYIQNSDTKAEITSLSDYHHNTSFQLNGDNDKGKQKRVSFDDDYKFPQERFSATLLERKNLGNSSPEIHISKKMNEINSLPATKSNNYNSIELGVKLNKENSFA